MEANLKHISSTELRTSLRDVLEDVRYRGDIYIVETFGRPMAVIVGIDRAYELALLPPQKSVRVSDMDSNSSG